MYRDRQNGRSTLSAWIAVVCVVFLLIATSVEAGHACELGLSSSSSQVSAGAASGATSHGACLLCLGAHSPSLAAAITPLLPEVVTAADPIVMAPAHRQLLQSFALQVRPPPAA